MPRGSRQNSFNKNKQISTSISDIFVFPLDLLISKKVRDIFLYVKGRKDYRNTVGHWNYPKH